MQLSTGCLCSAVAFAGLIGGRSESLLSSVRELPPGFGRPAVGEAHQRKKDIDHARIVFDFRQLAKSLVHFVGIKSDELFGFVNA